jgi:hypothetical protein
MTDQTTDLLSELLAGAVEQLDIPPNLFETIVARYEHLAEWLAEHCELDVVIEIYPQGSMRLGTPVQPDPPLVDFDIDMVFLIRVSKAGITKAELKDMVGKLLATYIELHDPGADVPKLAERGRCWTLEYHELGFHLDVLPAIPDEDNPPTGILLTDRELHLWQYSDPIAYADWFLIDRMPVRILERATAELAARLGKSIAEVPRFLVRTPLQRAVQVAKRHRDVFFADNADDKPPSILITTLIALSYLGGTNIRLILTDFLDALPGIALYEGGTWLVANPVAENENFADKWNTHPGRREAFQEWCDVLRADLDQASSAQGIDRMAAVLSKSLGTEPVQAATRMIGAAFGAAAALTGPAVNSLGHLTRRQPTTPAPHRFHGPRPPRP